MKNAQKIATRVFIFASLGFGLVGITAILSASDESDPPAWIMKTLGVFVMIILSSFGVSVGLKYLSNGKG